MDDLFSQYARKKKDEELRQLELNKDAELLKDEDGDSISEHSLGVESKEGVLGKSPIKESLKLFGDF